MTECQSGCLRVLGSWFLVLGSWFLVLGSWFLVLGSWLKSFLPRISRMGTNEDRGCEEGILTADE
ncbi:MAG: hypothetical protein ACK47H_14035 [Akkermansiaceae bacterium]